jgi:hypothetical protein
VLRHPEACVAQRLGILRERYGVPYGLAMRAIGNGNRLIEYGQAQG